MTKERSNIIRRKEIDILKSNMNTVYSLKKIRNNTWGVNTRIAMSNIIKVLESDIINTSADISIETAIELNNELTAKITNIDNGGV